MSAWLCENIRLSALWRFPEGKESALNWEHVVGAPPETRELQPRQGTVREVGPIQKGAASLALQVSPARADWVVTPIMPPTWDFDSFPNLGVAEDVIRIFDRMLFEKAASAYEAPRLALGMSAVKPAANREDSYATLGALLSTIQPNLKGAQEFLYQINRPRISLKVPELMVNRLSRWSAVVITGVRFIAGMPGSLESRASVPVHATRVELDINTSPERDRPISQADGVGLLKELSELALEILEKGDVA